MKIYILISTKEDEHGISEIVIHRRCHFFEEDAFKEALKIPDSCIAIFEQTGSFSLQQIMQYSQKEKAKE